MTYFQRLIYYSKEQLLPGSRLFLSFVIALFVHLLLEQHLNINSPSKLLIVPTLSPFFLLLYYRISDEFKDYEIDKKYFPERPIPSGLVRLSDLRSWLIILSIAGIFLNVVMPYALKEFLAAWAFTVLMGKWFFMERIISKNRLLAFNTHAPVGALLYYYVINFYLNFHSQMISTGSVASLIAFFVLPGFTWEILRKTFLPEDEKEGYQTYSSMLGLKRSLFFALTLLLITTANNYALINAFPTLALTLKALVAVNLLMSLAVLVQMIRPWISNLRGVTEVYMGFHLLLPLAYLIWLSYV